MRTTKRSKVAAFAVGLSLVLAACGGEEGTTDTTSGETTETTEDEGGDTTAPASEAAMRITYTLSDIAVWEDGSPITVADFQ
ncbi:MAG: hypothetical protein ACKOAZ_11360, partial [Ilumatobacteraceae bacterium]